MCLGIQRSGEAKGEKPNYRHRRLLPPRRERPRGRAAEERDELAAFHVAPVAQDRFDIANFSARSNEPLLSPGEYDRHRACILDHLACGSEQPRCSVYSKCDNGVALLVGRVEKVPCWVPTNEAWN